MTSHFRASDAKKLASEIKRAAKQSAADFRQAAKQSAAYTRKRRRKKTAQLSKVRMRIFQSAIDGKKFVAVKMSDFDVQSQLREDGFRFEPKAISWDHWGNVTVFRKGSGNFLVTGAYMFWICNVEGQNLLSRIYRMIKDFVERGHESIEIVTVKLSRRGSGKPAMEGDLSPIYAPKIELRVEDEMIAEVPLSPKLICKLFSLLGYKAALAGENTKEEHIRLSW